MGAKLEVVGMILEHVSIRVTANVCLHIMTAEIYGEHLRFASMNRILIGFRVNGVGAS